MSKIIRHTRRYYPGNCTLDCFGSRNCPAVITVGDMKLMLGFVGDPRIVPLNKTAGVDQKGSGQPVPWGLSGGHCNVAPPSGGVAEAVAEVDAAAESAAVGKHQMRRSDGSDGSDEPDPSCSRGVLSPVDSATCCAKSCGSCGGVDCGAKKGGSENCCRGKIDEGGRRCNEVGPPCKEGPPSPSPAPPPGPPGR
jgi:hypothetical protein